nr:cation/H+ exchanger, cation/H+ exchanger, CPA1 family [Tanacetum cinerariifolium]
NIDWEKLEGLKKWDITGKRPKELEEEEVNNMFKSSEIWDQVEDLKDGNFYVDLGHDNSVAYNLNLGLLPTSHVSVWECRLAVDYAKPKQEVDDKDRAIVVRLVNEYEYLRKLATIAK